MAHVNRAVSLRTLVLAASVSGVLGAALALGGCTSNDDRPSTPAAGRPGVPTTPASPPSSAPATTPAPPSPSPTTLTERLLATADVPGLNARWHWAEGETGAAPTTPFGLCAKADLLSIGATDVVQRTYFPPVDTDDGAAEQIAEFPDATTTATALKVLTSWREQCGSRRQGVTTSAGPLRPVTGGQEYLVTRSGPNPDDGLFQAVGLVRAGTRIAVLTMDVVAQDYRYPAGHDPMAAMVAAAARLLA